MEIKLTVEIITPEDGPPCYLWKSANGDYSIAVWKSDLIPTLLVDSVSGGSNITWNRPPTPNEIEQDGGIRFNFMYPTIM